MHHHPITSSYGASKAHTFSQLGANCILSIGRWVSSAAIYYKCHGPSPLPGQLAQLALLQVCQHLDRQDVVQSVLDGFQGAHLATTLHDNVCIQGAQGILVEQLD